MSNWFLIIIEAIQIASRSLVCKFQLETQQTECQVRNTVKNSSGRLSIVIRKTDFRMLGFKSAKRDIWQWKSSVKWSKKERRQGGVDGRLSKGFFVWNFSEVST